MLRSLISMIKRYPVQALLFIYNAGIFAWLQTTSHTIMEQIGLDDSWADKIPAPLKALTGASMSAMQELLSSSAWGWLIVSMILMLIIRFVKGVIKFVLTVVIILGGLYLFWQNMELINGLLK
ncbi:TPA: hypothetical protein ACHVHO_002144 [Streptococcus suis]